MAEYIDRRELYREIAELEELARKKVLDTPTNSPAYQRYVAQLNERTMLKHKICDVPTVNLVKVTRCKECGYGNCYDNINLMWECTRFLGSMPVRENDFCSYGIGRYNNEVD